MRQITIKDSKNETVLKGNFDNRVDALEELAQTQHGTFTAYRSCMFDGHLVFIGEFSI